MRWIVIFGGLCVGACAQFPQLDSRLPEGALDAPFPELLPLGELSSGPAATSAPAGPSADRIAALTARADALRRPVLTLADRARLQGGVNSRGL